MPLGLIKKVSQSYLKKPSVGDKSNLPPPPPPVSPTTGNDSANKGSSGTQFNREQPSRSVPMPPQGSVQRLTLQPIMTNDNIEAELAKGTESTASVSNYWSLRENLSVAP